MGKNIEHFLYKIKRYIGILENFRELRGYGKDDFHYLLLQTPIHGNLGDQAILECEQRWLEEKLGLRNVPECSTDLFISPYFHKQADRMIRRADVLLLHGGGFLGTLWMKEEEALRDILQTYGDKKIIILPQTVWFDMDSEEGRREFDTSHRIYAQHKDLTICLREQVSYQFMRENMPDVHCILAPDMVLAMKAPEFTNQRENRILFCFRRDMEKNVSDEQKEYIVNTVRAQYPDKETVYQDTVSNCIITSRKRSRYINDILAQFSKAQFVVTDRLHGMVFALVTGTPCIALNNKSGKVKALSQWIKTFPYIVYIDSVDELQDALQRLDITKKWRYDTAVLAGEYEALAYAIKDEKR